MGWYVAYLIICGLNGFICSLNGYHVGTWQFWFYTLAVVCSFNFACRDCEYRNIHDPTLRDNLLVTAGARAADMACLGIIGLPSGVEGEAQLAIFVSDVVDRYLGRFERINFDEYIENVLKKEYGSKTEVM